MSAPGPSAPSLVDLAHAAAAAIARYVDAADRACRSVGSGKGNPSSVEIERTAAFRALETLWLAEGLTTPAESRVLHDMREAVGAGIVRPEWGLRVVAIATAAQAGKAASDG